MAANGTPALYTPEQRARRDATVWTPVQAVLAPLQFTVFLVSLGLVLYSLNTGAATDWALGSVVAKTVLLYLIMVTGCIWEKVVFGQYLFAPAFFWEDVMSMGVLALHSAYLVVWQQGLWPASEQLALALAAYAAYAINAAQYLLKLRTARLQRPTAESALPPGAEGVHP